MPLTNDQRGIIRSKCENEGFDYCFYEYSDWKSIDDPEFHRLREAFLAARKALSEYVEVWE